MPDSEKDLANDISKDPYNFDFLAISEPYDEKELKDALIENIQKLLLELGTGFAFVGREVRLLVGETELFLDLLFYNIRLHAYVVIEVKSSKFKPDDLGQLGTYVSSVNHLLKNKGDCPTLGLLICKDKDEVVAEYSLENYNFPMGVSSYKLNGALPKELKNLCLASRKSKIVYLIKSNKEQGSGMDILSLVKGIIIKLLSYRYQRTNAAPFSKKRRFGLRFCNCLGLSGNIRLHLP